MMRALEVVMPLLSAGALATGGVMLRASGTAGQPPAIERGPVQAVVGARGKHPALDSLARAAAKKAAFRATRVATSVRYDAEHPDAVGAAAPPKPRPALAVSGIAWGGHAATSAVIEGLPGADGPRVVRTGEVFAGLRVRRIERDVVVVAAVDTIWTLRVREPWK